MSSLAGHDEPSEVWLVIREVFDVSLPWEPFSICVYVCFSFGCVYLLSGYEWDMTIWHICPYPQILLRMPPILADRVRFLFTEEEWRMELLWITTHKRWGGPVFGVGRVRRDKLCAQTIWWQPACRAQKGSCPHLPPPRVGKKINCNLNSNERLINNYLINLSLVRWSVRPPPQLSSIRFNPSSLSVEPRTCSVVWSPV